MAQQERKSIDRDMVGQYKRLHTSKPDWAWPFVPSIPFIGDAYQPGIGIVVYASAENFTWMHQATIPTRFTSEAAWNRYRAVYEERGRTSVEFFPDVGIQPVTNGGLLAAALFVAEQQGLPQLQTPREFLETLAVTNWCKYSIRSETNRDYLADTQKLTESLPYVVAELCTLKPAFVLIPQQIWRRPILRAAMRGASPATRFLPVPQFNVTVVNCHLTKHTSNATHNQRRFRGTPLGEWMKHLRGFTPANAWRYFVELQNRLADTAPAGSSKQP